MKIKQNIPNFLTCCNLLCGCLAIVCAFEGNLVWSAYLVGIAAVFDFFDGFAARMLGVSSPIGKDLDSLADMVTFGVVPGIVIYKIMTISYNDEMFYDMQKEMLSSTEVGPFLNNSFIFNIWPLIAFLIPVFSAIRLAKFNNDTRQTESFIGLPTPANAIFICSLPLILNWIIPLEIKESFSEQRSTYYTVYEFIMNRGSLIFITILLSLLLVAPLPLFALKFKSFGWKGNEIRYVFLGLSLLLLITLKFIGIPLVIILYILLSVINNLFFKTKSSMEGV